MPQVILNRMQTINGIALHPFEPINVTESVKDVLEARGALMSEDELQAIEASAEAEAIAKTQVFEPVEIAPQTAPAPLAPAAPLVRLQEPAKTPTVTAPTAPSSAS